MIMTWTENFCKQIQHGNDLAGQDLHWPTRRH